MDSRAALRFVTSRHLLPAHAVVDPATARGDLRVFTAVYLVGFGTAVLVALAELLASVGLPHDLVEGLAELSLFGLWDPLQTLWYEASGVVAAAAMVFWLVARRGMQPGDVGLARPRPSSPRSHAGGLLLAALAYWGLLVVSQFAVAVADAYGYGTEVESIDAGPGLMLVLGPVWGLTAGLSEEILLVGCYVVVAERAGWSTTRIYAIGATIRLMFHLYYGIAGLALLPWAIGSLWLFRRTRSVLPLILGHLLWNTWVIWPDPLGSWLFWAVPIVLVLGLVRTWRSRPAAAVAR